MANSDAVIGIRSPVLIGKWRIPAAVAGCSRELSRANFLASLPTAAAGFCVNGKSHRKANTPTAALSGSDCWTPVLTGLHVKNLLNKYWLSFLLLLDFGGI